MGSLTGWCTITVSHTHDGVVIGCGCGFPSRRKDASAGGDSTRLAPPSSMCHLSGLLLEFAGQLGPADMNPEGAIARSPSQRGFPSKRPSSPPLTWTGKAHSGTDIPPRIAVTRAAQRKRRDIYPEPVRARMGTAMPPGRIAVGGPHSSPQGCNGTSMMEMMKPMKSMKSQYMRPLK